MFCLWKGVAKVAEIAKKTGAPTGFKLTNSKNY